MVKKILFMVLLILSVPLYATAALVNLPQTGETLCYNDSGPIPCDGTTGQDGEKKIGAAWPSPRFTVNLTAALDPDGTVTDNLTGLIWLMDSKCAALHSTTDNPSGGSTWAAALTKANGLSSGSCGLTDGSHAGDWRLPNVNELASLIDISQNPPFPAGNPFSIVHIYDPFPATPEYWTSTNEAVYPTNSEGINISTGDVRGTLQTALKNVWPVRGTSTTIAQTGQTSCPDPTAMTPPFPTIPCPAGADGDLQKGVAWPTPPRFVDNLDGTLTDNLTGLIWLQRADCFNVVNTQAVALASAKGLASNSCALTDGSLPGDWRLPNRNEMRSLVNYGQASGTDWLLSNGFINPQGGWYWSSDSYPIVPFTSVKWMIKSEGGTWLSATVATDAPTDLKLMLPVRGPLIAQSITFSDATTHTFGDLPVDLTTLFTGGLSGKALTFTLLSGPGALSGSNNSILTFNGAGNIVVQASQAGNVTYAAAAGTQQTIAVKKAVAAVTFTGSLSQTYDGTQKSVAATTVPPGVAVAVTYNGSATAPISAGTYAVLATISDANYQGTAASDNLVIAQAPATVTLNGSPSQGYDGTAKSLTATTVPPGVAVAVTYSGSTSAPINAGTYQVVASITDPNYTGTAANGSLTVTQKTPAITWSTPSAIVSGTALSATQLNAASDVTGTFVYTPAVGAVPAAGPQTLSVIFTPDTANSTNYTTATATVSLTVTPTFTVTFAADSNGSLTGTASQTVASGAATSAVLAVPATGYHFVQWTGPGSFTSTSNPLTVSNVTAAQTLTASFAADAFTVNFAAGSNGSLTGTASQTVNSGASASAVTAIPATGYHFVQWTGTGGFTSSDNPLTLTNVTAAQTITANFEVTTFTVTFAAGSNGSLTGTASQIVNSGAAASAVTAIPATGYRFVQWTGTGGFTSTSNPLALANVTADQTVTASFTANTFTVTFAAGSNGSLTGTASQTVNSGASASAVTAVPATGYHFVQWTGPGSFTSTSNPLTVSNVTATQTLAASFAINTFQVTGSVTGGNGTISCTPTVNYGSNATCTVTPTAGYHLLTLTDNSADQLSAVSGTTFTISNVTANQAVVTTFARPTGIINAKSGKTAPDVSDALAVLNMYLKITPTTAANCARADIAPLGADGKPLGDGKLDIYDVIGILRMSIGLD
jgi:uncharacterized repeat protein (TIGR02543 family)